MGEKINIIRFLEIKKGHWVGSDPKL